MNATAQISSMALQPDGTDPRVKDRLITTLFLAALFHGIVILGITFTQSGPRERPTPTLEVLLLTGDDTRAADNAEAQYLAQRNQRGSGTTEERVRPANPTSSLLPIQRDGIADGNAESYRQAIAGQPAVEIISARSERAEVEFRSGQNTPSQQAQTPLALTSTPAQTIATQTTDRSLRLRGVRADGEEEILPNTRQSQLAPYLDAWRTKVERLGTLNFPAQVAGDGMGNPVLEVALRADGSLGAALIQRSSGRREIDQAALSILRIASPFDPFPADVARRYQELRFAYEWQFLTGD